MGEYRSSDCGISAVPAELTEVLFPAKQTMLLSEVRPASHSRRRVCAELFSAPERYFMSYRNGDRSREHRLRKARIARRLKIKEVREAAAKPMTEAKSAKLAKSK